VDNEGGLGMVVPRLGRVTRTFSRCAASGRKDVAELGPSRLDESIADTLVSVRRLAARIAPDLGDQ
jgi:hypothetical protein